MHSEYAIYLDGYPVSWVKILRGDHLAELHTVAPHRKRGFGRRIMKMVCDDADRHGITLDLMAAGEFGAMSTQELETWYMRFGFVRQPNLMMVRPPRVKK